MTEKVARAKAQRETAVGASRRQVTLGEYHSRVAGAKITVVSADSQGVTLTRID